MYFKQLLIKILYKMPSIYIFVTPEIQIASIQEEHSVERGRIEHTLLLLHLKKNYVNKVPSLPLSKL